MSAPGTAGADRFARFGGWLIPLWLFGCLMASWHLLSVIGDGRALSAMFESPANVTLMRAILWLRILTWMPLLILAPLHSRRMPVLAGAGIAAGALLEAGAVIFWLDLEGSKVWALVSFDAFVVLVAGAYLARSRRVAATYGRYAINDGRARRHGILLALVAGTLTIAIFAGPAAATIDRVSIVSAYQFAVLLSVILMIGPWRALKSRHRPINIHARRDIGIWAGITGLLHLYAGTGQAMTPDYIATFVAVPTAGVTMASRNDVFVWGTIAGLLIGVLLLLLLALSNDRSVRRLSSRWWKRLQRTSYLVFVLTYGHALAFQYLETRSPWLVVGVICLGGSVLVAQVAGFRARVRNRG